MARFVLNQPIDTREPTIAVDAGLAVGRHRFQLEVFDSAGQRSRPDSVIIEIVRIAGPVEPTDPVGPIGPLDPVGPVRPLDPVGPIGPVDPVGPVRNVRPGTRRRRSRKE